jgi:multiple sugar transport system permease protein
MSTALQSRRSVFAFRRVTLRQRFYIVAILLLLPAIGLRLFTTVYPFIQTAALSVQRYNPAYPPQKFVGFGNFERMFNDPVVQASIGFTILFVAVSTFFQVGMGLALAHLLNAPFRLRGLARTLSLIPWAIPMAITALGFRWMFDDQFGMIPDLLRRGLGVSMPWLIDPNNAKVAVIFVSVWKSTPFVGLVLLAGLQGIPRDLYEAAKVDGANWLSALRFITIPMLMPIIITTSMFMLVWQLAVFDLPFLMTGGGPGFSTTVMAQKIYLESNSLNYGYASAIGVVMVLIVALVGGIGLFLFRRFDVIE